MEEVWKKTRLWIFIGFSIVLVESLAGFSTLYTGILFREYDSKSAEEMLTVIKDNNPEYYAMLNDTNDLSQKQEFDRLYTTRGNKILLSFGIIILSMAILTMVPVSMLYMKLNFPLTKTAEKEKKEKKEKKEEKGGKKEDEESF
jgi:hypothetical protein